MLIGLRLRCLELHNTQLIWAKLSYELALLFVKQQGNYLTSAMVLGIFGVLAFVVKQYA